VPDTQGAGLPPTLTQREHRTRCVRPVLCNAARPVALSVRCRVRWRGSSWVRARRLPGILHLQAQSGCEKQNASGPSQVHRAMRTDT